jgi:NAD(P)-dependent dehydrogenase (short-subunit alcohol dehydrogenase family)
MGEELARDLVKSGWNIVMADIQPNPDLSKELGDAASFVECNVADYNSQAAMFQETWNRHGRLDALCANAGIVDKRFAMFRCEVTDGADGWTARYISWIIAIRMSMS